MYLFHFFLFCKISKKTTIAKSSNNMASEELSTESGSDPRRELEVVI